MQNTRLIARLDIKGPNLIKGIHLEGLRVLGSPNEFARRYYDEGADELIYMDAVASLYGRNSLQDIVKAAAEDVFVPMTVGGGVRSVSDAGDVLRCGADKVAVNTAAVARPELISEIARRFGSQCMVLSIEAKQIRADVWEAYTDNGREPTGRDVLAWAQEGVSRGAGEVLLTSVDRDGTNKGFDTALVRAVSQAVPVPVIASGGAGSPSDVVDVVQQGRADAVAIAGIVQMKAMGVEARPVFFPMHQMPPYKRYFAAGQTFAGSITASSGGISLPSGVNMLEADIDRVVEVFTDIVDRHRTRVGAG